MTAAVVALACALAALVIVLGVLLHAQSKERQAWAVERRQLVDRAIARHAGEVLALDRADKPRERHDEPRLVEGMS